MSLIQDRIKHYVNNIAFLLLFPGYFYYNFFVAKMVIDPFLYGYFGYMSLILFPVLFLINFKDIQKGISGVEILFFLLLFYTFIIATINLYKNNPYGYSYEMFKWSVSGILYNSLMYIIGKTNNKSHAIVLFLLFILISILAICALNIDDSYKIFYLRETTDKNVREYISTYQGLARTIVIIGFTTISYYYYKNILVLLFAIIIYNISLYLNGARTELYVSLITILIIGLYLRRKHEKVLILLSVVILGIGIYLMYPYYQESRIYEIIKYEQSTSFIARKELLDYGMNVIANSPIWGNYGSYVKILGIGSYVHNILSAWQNLGIIGFLIYIIIFVKMWIFMIKLRNCSDDEFLEYKIFLIYTTIALMLSKDYTYMFVGYTIGLYSKVNLKKIIRIRNS